MGPEYRAGQMIPGTQYRVQKSLGEGGQGAVYSVEHTFLEAPAVIKLLHADFAPRADLAERITREARTLAKLRHPNIVEVRDGGLTKEDPPRPFFVMESLHGMSLRELLRHVPSGLAAVAAIRILIGVLEGLEHAHRAGVIHRDIKPDNVFLHRTSTDLTVPKILDFGIAHLAVTQQKTGRHFVGTPRYASPEQLRGDAPSVPSDLYSAGLVLYELLTGEVPFSHVKDLRGMLHAHENEILPPVSLRVPGANGSLDDLLASLLAKRPGKRPQSAIAAASALREIRARFEKENAGSIHAAEFNTETMPLENILFEAHPEELAVLGRGGATTAERTSTTSETVIDMAIPAHEVDRDADTLGAISAPQPVARVATNDTQGIGATHLALAQTSPVSQTVEHTTGQLGMATGGEPADVQSLSEVALRTKSKKQTVVLAATAACVLAIGITVAFQGLRNGRRSTDTRTTGPASAAPFEETLMMGTVTASAMTATRQARRATTLRRRRSMM